MASVPAQKLSTLFIPMLGVALLAGALMGALGGGLLVLPDILDSSGDSDGFSAWGGPVGYALIPILYGTVFGTFIALVPGTGSFISLAIQSMRHPTSSGNRQAVAAGVGAAVAGFIPAIALVWGVEEVPKGSVVTGGIFIVVCFVIAFLALRVILRFIDKRDAELRTVN